MDKFSDMVVVRKEGLFCVPGKFYIDPWLPVEHALITHAHSDHARAGHLYYLSTASSVNILKARLGNINIEGLEYGAQVLHNEVKISFHPAGHVLGSAQIRLEYRGEVWVISGDYKLDPDLTCLPFEPVRCHTFITESTFGLPIYRWPTTQEIFKDIHGWWRMNASEGRPSIIFAYAFGKAQRILANLATDIGPIICHGAVERLNNTYREQGIVFPATFSVNDFSNKSLYKNALVIAPPSAARSTWMKRFGDYSDAFASGWMLTRGARRRRGVDKGFPISDHADWPSLMSAISATEAQNIIVTHGSVDIMVRWLQQLGFAARAFDTSYEAADSSNALSSDEHA